MKQGLLGRLIDRVFTEHVTIGPVTIYGANAMHWAVNVKTPDGYVCAHPTTRTFGGNWPWYVYISRNATPGSAVWGIGPGYREQAGPPSMTRELWDILWSHAGERGNPTEGAIEALKRIIRERDGVVRVAVKRAIERARNQHRSHVDEDSTCAFCTGDFT